MEERERAAIQAWIEQQHGNLARSSYYAIIGVGKDASERDIRDQYYRLAARFHPDLYGQLLDPPTRTKLVSLYSRIVEAYQVLSNGQKRSQYDKGLANGKIRWSEDDARAPKPAADASIANPNARRLFQLGRAALRAGDAKSAVMNFKMALSAEPRSALIKAELAQAEERLKKPGP